MEVIPGGHLFVVVLCDWVHQVAEVKDSKGALHIVAIAIRLRLTSTRRWHLCLSTCAGSDQMYRQKRVASTLFHTARQVGWVGHGEEATFQLSRWWTMFKRRHFQLNGWWTTFSDSAFILTPAESRLWEGD